MADDVSSRILAAATLAEQAAEKLERQRYRPMGLEDTQPIDVRHASGPSHWGAVAELLRAVEATHDRYWRACSQGEHHCRHGYIACENLSALLPLADQIIRDLGDGQND